MGHDEGMPTPETVSPYTHVEPTEPVVSSQPVDARGRLLASAIAVFLGGYLLISAVGGQLPIALSGYTGGGPELAVLLLLQLAFAVAVVLTGFFLAPGAVGLKLIASAIVVVGVTITVVILVARINGSISAGIPLLSTLANPYFMTVAVVGAAWLVVRSARLGWLALLATILLIPIPTLMTTMGVTFATAQILILFVAAIVGVGIIAAGRPARG